ncbi:gp58-like family protein [uncultured Lactobacillus sp.]|uniref:gp58-like family protein n=1 Tax=uncultured Lactobacillus sp. TaxID=153152 RepID=UPI00259A8F39|nr:gp58-like family protein [uncultured Lactobacillus sp.]
MLTQTKEVRDAWRASQRILDIKVVVNGKTYSATDINSLKYDSGAYTGDTFAIGSTYSNSVQIEFSHLIENLKLGMEVLPSIGIKTSKGYIYEPLGVFIISSEIKMDRNNNLTSISASDRFCGLEGTYKSKLAYPAKVLDVIAEICAQSGVRANVDDLARLPHQADLPSAITGQTYRKALGWIAQLYAGYATFDRQGLFTIRTIAEPNYELDPSQYEQAGLTKNEAPYRISGIQCQTTITTKTRDGEDTEETKNYQVGDSNGSQIKLENNIMTPDRLTNIWEQIKDINFYPFSLNWFGNPAIEAGDWLKLQDKQGNKFIVPNNSYTLDFNGGLSATSKADQTSSTDSGIAWEGTFSQTIRELQGRKAPDGTVIFPPSVTEPPTNAKPNDVWFKQNGNSTELWVFTEQEDGTGKWIRRDLTPDEIKKQVQEAQDGLKDAKKEIADNLAKSDSDIAELNASIAGQNSKIDGLSTSVNTVVIPKITDITNQVSDAVTKVNEQKNIVTGLQNQATQQGKDISNITTDVHGVTVDLANLNGDVNQTKATVQGLQTTLGNAQGDIAQIKVDAKKLSTSLSGKVDTSTYANFVNATNSALNAKLVASDLNGYAKTTDVQATANGLQININSVANRMNNLKIGGRNLVANTGKEYVMGFGIPNTIWQNGYAHSVLPQGDGDEIVPQGPYDFWYNLTSQQEYTQTIWFRTDAEIKDLNNADITWFSMGDSHDMQSAKIQKIGINSYKIFSTYVWPKDKKDNRVRLFDIRLLNKAFNLNSGTYLDFGKLKLEVGNASTDWTPALEDTDHDISQVQSQISQTAGTIRDEVTDRTNNLQSQITQNANNINLKVNAVGDLSNICLNPNFDDGSTAGWENISSSTGNGGSPSKFYGGISIRDGFYGNMFSVSAGDKYYFSVFAWQNQSSHNFSIGLAYLQKDGSRNWQPALTFTPNEGGREKTGAITIPSNAVKARIWVQIDAYSDYGHWWFTNVNVRKNDTLAQINMSAGTTLIQNDKIYMDASSTVFSGKAFIPSAAITSLNADKIDTGTLDAGRINVINLNANNITTGTINGANLKINLNDGEILFQKGRIASTNGNLNIDLDNGRMSVTNWMHQGVYFQDGNMVFDDQASWLTSNNDPKYGGIKRADWSTFAGSNGLEIYAQNGIVLKSKNFNGALDNGSFVDSATTGAALGLNKDGDVLLKSTKFIKLTGGNQFDLFRSGGYQALNPYPSISIGTGAFGGNDAVKKGSRIIIEGSYVHVPSVYYATTGSAPNVYVASDGALVRSTSASKYKTDIQRSYSTDYGDKLLNLPTAIWTDKGQKERYEAGSRHIKPEKYFGMIAEDLADAGLDLLVSRNPLTHEIEGIQYERIAPALLPVIKKLKDKVNRLEKKVNE